MNIIEKISAKNYEEEVLLNLSLKNLSLIEYQKNINKIINLIQSKGIGMDSLISEENSEIKSIILNLNKNCLSFMKKFFHENDYVSDKIKVSKTHLDILENILDSFPNDEEFIISNDESEDDESEDDDESLKEELKIIASEESIAIKNTDSMVEFDEKNIENILVSESNFLSLDLIEFILSKIRPEDLNLIDEIKDTCILDRCIRKSSSYYLLPILQKNGLNIENIFGINIYNYILKNKLNHNILPKILVHLNVQTNNSLFSKIINLMVDESVTDDYSFLLKHCDFNFVSPTNTKIWTYLSEQSYTVIEKIIKQLPDSFYLHYKNSKDMTAFLLEKKEILELIIENSKLSLLYQDEKNFSKFLISLAESDKNFKLYILKSAIKTLDKKSIKLSVEDAERIRFLNKSLNEIEELSLFKFLKELKLRNKKFVVSNTDLKNFENIIDFYKYVISDESLNHYLNNLENIIDRSYNNQNSDLKSILNNASDTANSNAKHRYNNKFIYVVETFNYLEFKDKDLIYFENFVNLLNKKDFKILLDKTLDLANKKFGNFSNDWNDVGDNILEHDYSFSLFSDKNYQKFKKENKDNDNVSIVKFLKKDKNYMQSRQLASVESFLNKRDELLETFPHFSEVIEHINNLMLLQDKGDKTFYIPPLLMAGGAGVGKTFFCNTLSKVINSSFNMVSMESLTSGFILTGLDSKWGNSASGLIFNTLMDEENKNMNPIFLLDEIEKAPVDTQHPVLNTLLSLLERYTAKNFKDECINLPIDASYIIWLATANDISKLSAPIKSRFDIFSIPNPTLVQRKSLLRAIYKVVIESNSWGHFFSKNLPEESLNLLVNIMSPGAARDMRKNITIACANAIKEDSKEILPRHIKGFQMQELMPWDQSITLELQKS